MKSKQMNLIYQIGFGKEISSKITNADMATMNVDYIFDVILNCN